MMHIYKIPEQRSNGFCFAGPVPVAFGNVDWLDTPPDDMDRSKVEDFIRGKIYFQTASPGTRFLVLCDREDLTFQMVRSEE